MMLSLFMSVVGFQNPNVIFVSEETANVLFPRLAALTTRPQLASPLTFLARGLEDYRGSYRRIYGLCHWHQVQTQPFGPFLSQQFSVCSLCPKCVVLWPQVRLL